VIPPYESLTDTKTTTYGNLKGYFVILKQEQFVVVDEVFVTLV